MRSRVIPLGRWPSRARSHFPGGWPAGHRRQCEKQVGEHADGSGRVGEERYPLDARLAYRSPPDYLSHSFLGARTTASPHYHSVRASANRYEERYEQELLASLCSGLRKTWLRPGPMGWAADAPELAYWHHALILAASRPR